MTTVHVLEQQLLEQIVTRDNLMRAWKRVKANKGAAGVDTMTVKDFPTWARAHWPNIKTQLLAGDYDRHGWRKCRYCRSKYLPTGRGTTRVDTQTQRRQKTAGYSLCRGSRNPTSYAQSTSWGRPPRKCSPRSTSHCSVITVTVSGPAEAHTRRFRKCVKPFGLETAL